MSTSDIGPIDRTITSTSIVAGGPLKKKYRILIVGL